MKKTLLFTLLLIFTVGLNAANVAKIRNSYYASLSAAFASLQNGDTIFLLSDVTQTTSIIIDRPVSFVFDGNGLSITRNANVDLFQFSASVSATFCNTTFKKGANASSLIYYRSFYLSGDSYAALTLLDCQLLDYTNLYVGNNDTARVVGCSCNGECLVSYNFGNTFIQDGEFQISSSLILNNFDNGVLTIDEGLFYLRDGIVEYNYGKISFLGGEYFSDYGFRNQWGGIVTIKGGDFNSKRWFADNNGADSKIQIDSLSSFYTGDDYAVFQNNLVGVTTTDNYYFYPSKDALNHIETRLREPVVLSYYVSDMLYQTTSGLTGPLTEVIALPVDSTNNHIYSQWVDSIGDPVRLNSTFIAGDTRFYAEEGPAVARIGETLYGNLSSAFSHVGDLDTIVLLKDVRVENPIFVSNDITFVFDGNGHTIENLCSENSLPLFNFIVGASATFQNVVVETNGSLAESSYSTLINMPDGIGANLTLKNCQLQDYNILRAGTTNKVTVEGGFLQAYNCLADTLSGDLYVLDGFFSIRYDFVNYNFALVQIDSGTFDLGSGVVGYNYDTLIVKNGVFDLDYVVYENIGGYVNLQDGDFDSEGYIVEYNENRDSNGEVDYDDVDPTGVRGKVLVNDGIYRTQYEWIYENHGDVEIDEMDATTVDDYFVSYNYAVGTLVIHNGTVRSAYDSYGSPAYNYGLIRIDNGNYELAADFITENYGSIQIDNGVFIGNEESDSDFIHRNYGIVVVNCEELVCGGDFIETNENNGLVTLNCGKMKCGGNIVETNSGEIHIVDGNYESFRLVGDNNLSRPPRPGSDFVAPKCIVENGTFVCRGCGFVVNNGTVDIHCDTFECGRDFLVENNDGGQVTLNCSIMVCVGDVVSNNAGTLVFANGYYYSDDDLVENNYGSVKIYDGNYETEDDIISYNEENATLKVLGGTFKSYHSLLYSNYGYARFDNVNYTSTDYYVVGNNYENGVLQINSGEYVSDSSSCICGDYSNEGFILLRGGSFRGKDDGIRNGRGTVLFDGFVVIDVADDTDGVLICHNMDDVEINDIYIFYPEKTSTGHLETILNPDAPDVAQIDTVKFKTLEAAFAAASSGDTILLLENIAIKQPLMLNRAVDVVLDGDGHTLTAALQTPPNPSHGYDGYIMIEIVDALHLTVKNLTTDVADSLQYGVLFYLDDNARANLHFENTTFHGYDIFWNGARDTLTLENCISSGIESDIVNYNYGFVSFQSGEYAANDDIIGDNYGILEIYDGNYETDYDIIGYNEENATLEVLGGTFKSYYSLLYMNFGIAIFDDVNYTSTDYYVIGNNYSTGVLQINGGEYVSENYYCICADSPNQGFILLRGGTFRGRDDGINNGTGDVLFDGEVTIETSYDSDGVLYGDLSKITVSPEYVFYPSKNAQGLLRTVPKTPVPVQFFVEDTLWHTEMHIPGEMDFDFPSFPTSGHPCPYDYWMDSVGQRVWNQYGIGLETRLYAHRPADSVNVTFVDGGSSTTVVVENGTPAANIPAFNAISNANFYGWQDENMLFYNDSTRVNGDVTLTAFYVVGDTVCNFNELKAAVNDKKPVIILCDMIPVLENLKITVSTTIVGMDSLCGLKRTSDYKNDPMVSIFDTLTVNFINLKLEGDSIRSNAAAIRVYARAGYPLNEHNYPIVPYDSASNRYVFANVNLINCWCQNFYHQGNGGVIEASYTNLNLVSCDFEHNYAGNGGAVYWEPYSDYASANQNYKKGSLCTIRNCKFLYNECNSDGAAIVMGTGGSYLRDATSIDEMLDFCSMVIYDSQISYNTSAGSSGAIGTGWGVYALRGNTEVSYNYAERMGGVTGSYNNMLLILMDDVKVTHNQSYDGGAFGFSEGGMWMYGNSTLSFNEAEYGGAIYTGNMDDYHYIFAENATIYGNRASSIGGALYSSDKFSFTSGHIYDNYAGDDGDDIDSYPTYVLDLIEEQPNRLYGSDTIGTRTIFVDEIPDRPTPAGISIPWKSWYKDGYSPRFHDPITSEVVDGFSLYNGDWYALKAIWYGLLLNYDANHGTDENVFADKAVKMYGRKTVENNMFEYPMHEFLGWNTEADGTGTHYDPEDIIIFDDHSQILYAEWCDMSTDTTFATSCTNYVWNGETYTESGTYTKIIELENSCDSLDVLVLTLADEPLQVTITPDSHSACPGVEAVLRAEVTSASDVLAYAWSTSATNDTLIVAPSTTSSYSLTVTDGYGCVGSDTVVITVNPSYAQSESLTLCQNELPYTWRDTTFNAGTTTGDYIFSRQTVNGCDSTVTLTLTVNPSYAQSESLTICQNELPYTWRDTTFNAGTVTGDYVFNRQTVNGCDSTVTLHLTVNLSYAQSESLTLCQNELPYEWRDTTFSAGTTTGDYVFNRQTANGCDSTVTLHLTVNPSYDQDENLTLCQNELPYEWRDTTFSAGTTTGDYVFSRHTVNGCDSTVTLHLTVNPSYNQDESLTVCQNELPYEWRDTTFSAGTTTGDYVFSRHTVNGCDSTVTLHLTVNPSYDQSESLTLCQNELPYEWRDTTFNAGTTTGDYVFSRQTANGCDSIVTLHLTVNPSYDQSESLTVCQNELPYEWRDTTFSAGTTTGDYVFSRHTVNGCDSIVTLHLTIKPSALAMDDKTDYIRCNGSAFSVTPTGTDIPEGTLYIWAVEDNVNVTGQSAQTTPVAAPISQTLTNNSDSSQTVVYHATPVTDGCMGDAFTITVDVEPTSELTLTCPDDIYDTLEFGSCALFIAPEDLGTPTWAHSLGWVLIDITNDAPADNIYPEGDNVITWTLTDECGNEQTCTQHVFVIFPECPNAVDYEGNEYIGVRIDCDCWTQRNLESNKYSDGTDIPDVYNYESDMYPDTDENVDKFGRLYDWESAINDGADNGNGHVQGICPMGWYLPTAEQYETLNLHGAEALKAPNYWLDGGGNNSTGFTSLPAGYYDGSVARYVNLMGEAYYWSTTKVGGQWTTTACSIQHRCHDITTIEARSGLGYSVRCIKEKE